MIEIKKEKIAEMMFGIWHESDNLKNPVMVGKYIADKLKEVINYTDCCIELKEGENKTDSVVSNVTSKLVLFADWLQYNGKWSLPEQQVEDFLKEQQHEQNI